VFIKITMRAIGFTFFLCLLLFCQIAEAVKPAPPPPQAVITNVFIDFNSGVVAILGENLYVNSIMPIVTLAGIPDSLVLLSYDTHEIIAHLPANIADGDYVLTVSTPTTAKYDLTIGAVGPQGPTGPQGLQGPPGAMGITCQVGQVLAQTTSGWACRSLAVFPNAVGICAGSSCDLSCNVGWGNCDSDTTNGCEANLATDSSNCSACGMACPSSPHASSTCSNGTCSALLCNAGFADCDNNPTNGCETYPRDDPNNCGACGNVCGSVNNGTTTCSKGACRIAFCNEGYGDCDGNPDNGCETYTNDDPENCWGCGNICRSDNGTATCSAGLCGIICNPGFADCDYNPYNGCEIETYADSNNCGACGNVCEPWQTCNGGSCI